MLCDLIQESDGQIAFSMCNPPFFADEDRAAEFPLPEEEEGEGQEEEEGEGEGEEATDGKKQQQQEQQKGKGRNPRTVCMGSYNEMCAEGGEVSFVKRMIQDSLVLRNQIRWYTTMIGRKVDLTEIMAYLKQVGVRNILLGICRFSLTLTAFFFFFRSRTFVTPLFIKAVPHDGASLGLSLMTALPNTWYLRLSLSLSISISSLSLSLSLNSLSVL